MAESGISRKANALIEENTRIHAVVVGRDAITVGLSEADLFEYR